MKTTSTFLTKLFENHCQWLENEGEDNVEEKSDDSDDDDSKDDDDKDETEA